MSLDRIKGAIWFEKAAGQQILIVGQGGIGSWLTLAVSRTGYCLINTVDYDSVEHHNLTGQLFKESQIGESKVDAVKETVYEFSSNCNISSYNCRYDPSLLRPVTFGALDNMSTRKYLFETWFKRYAQVKDAIFIDGRLTAEQLQIFAITGDNIKRAEHYMNNHLFSDDEVEEDRCTFKQSTFMAMTIAGLMTGIYTNHLANRVLEDNAYQVPYLTEFIIPVCMFEKEVEHAVSS